MFGTIEKPAENYSFEKATNLVKVLNADIDDDWTYEVVPAENSTVFFNIQITDEDGFVIGRM